MRKTILTVLLATSVAMPAMAQDWGRRNRDRGDNAQAEQARPQRAEREQRRERVEREQPTVAERANWSERGAERQRAVEQQAAHDAAVEQRPAVEQRRERRSWQEQQRGQNGNGNVAEVAVQPRVRTIDDGGALMRRQVRTRDGVTVRYGDGTRDGVRVRDRDGTRDGVRDGDRTRDGVRVRDGDRTRDGYRSGDRRSTYDRTGTRWSSQWRSDRNYDWRRYRDRNRSIYRLGHYRDPFGSRYRRFSIGFSLFPSYYSSNYWLDDPYMYRLPPAYGPYRWVRYYGDALLVNIYTGQVVDVVYDFFW